MQARSVGVLVVMSRRTSDVQRGLFKFGETSCVILLELGPATTADRHVICQDVHVCMQLRQGLFVDYLIQLLCLAGFR